MYIYIYINTKYLDVLQALIRCACVPLACASVNYFVQHLRRWRTTGGKGEEHGECGSRNPFVIHMVLMI